MRSVFRRGVWIAEGDTLCLLDRHGQLSAFLPCSAGSAECTVISVKPGIETGWILERLQASIQGYQSLSLTHVVCLVENDLDLYSVLLLSSLWDSHVLRVATKRK